MQLNVFIVGATSGAFTIDGNSVTTIDQAANHGMFMAALDEGHVIVGDVSKVVAGDVELVTSIKVTTVTEGRTARRNAVANSIAGVLQMTSL